MHRSTLGVRHRSNVNSRGERATRASDPGSPDRRGGAGLLLGFPLVAALLAGCSDYGIKLADAEYGATDTGAGWGVDTDPGEFTPACTDAPTFSEGVAVDESCASNPSVGTLEAVIEWSRASLGDMREYTQVLMAPAVGPLFDGDGDGDIDRDDPSSIVIVADDDGADGAEEHGVLRVLDGRDGEAQSGVSRVLADDLQIFPYRYSNVALGDLDGNGTPEIVAVVTVVDGAPVDPENEDTAEPGGYDRTNEEADTGVVVLPAPPSHSAPAFGEDACRIAAFTPDGALAWVAREPAIACGGHAPALADLEGDGTVEVIVGAVILEGATGGWRATGGVGGGRPPGFEEAGWMSFAADLEGDGVQEIVTGTALYTPEGATRCWTGAADGFPAVADFDGDGVGEVVSVSDGTLRVFDAACAVRTVTPLVGDGFGGPPSIGDLDGDGQPEIGVANADAYTAYEADGTVLWSVPVSDWSSSSAGAAFYDFDGDGRLEVVYADETALWILDGASGAVRLQDDTHASRTLHEVPVVADVDGDGMTEIVVPNGGSHADIAATGLYVLGSAHHDWTAGRRVWNQHAYSITNVDDDLRVPSHPSSNWPTWNSFRSGTIDPVGGGALPDAVPLLEVCTDSCGDGRLYVDVAVGNQGMAGLRASVPITLYVDGAAVGTAWTESVVPPGGVSPAMRFEVEAGTTVHVAVDDDGLGGERVAECEERDNGVDREACD